MVLLQSEANNKIGREKFATTHHAPWQLPSRVVEMRSTEKPDWNEVEGLSVHVSSFGHINK